MDFSRFDNGALHEDQRARLGIEITDVDNARWGYIRVREVMNYGQVVRMSKHADLVTTDPGAVTAAAAIGSDRLTTTNGFVLGGVTQDLRGCLGQITDGTGQSQAFYILEHDDDEAKVFVLTGNTNRNKNQGWAVALDTTSEFELYFPGEGRQGDGTADVIEGILQTDAAATDIGKYCWVKRSGRTEVLIDASGTNVTEGGLIVPSGGGLVQGGTSAHAIGRALVPATDLDADTLLSCNLNIPTGPVSYARAATKNAFNEVVIR